MARRSLSGLRVVVTGASSGIGRSLALELGRRKARTLLVARRGDVLRGVCDEVSSLGGVALAVVGDITQPTCRADIARTADDHFGGLDVLVNNAGTSAHGDFASESPDVTRQIFELNFFSAAELTREVIPLLREGERPMIVNIGSILGQRGIPYNATYCASKFALAGWSEALRAELAPLGIDLLLVSPGSTDTPFREHLVEKRISLSWERRRGVSPDHVARLTCNAIERGAHRLTTDWPGWGLLVAHRLAPGVVDWAMARLARRQTK
jgi:short-subunit dehydrogenase